MRRPGRGPFEKLRSGTARRIVKPGQVFSRIHAEDIAQVLAASIARRGLIQSISVFPVVDAEGNDTGMFEVPAGGRRGRRAGDRPGEGEVAADVAEPLGVVGVEGDAAPWCRGHGHHRAGPL